MTKMHKDDTWKPAANDNYPLVRVAGGRGGWRRATSIDVIKNMPGTPYYFGRELHKTLGIAIGLVPAGAGGTSLWNGPQRKSINCPRCSHYFRLWSNGFSFIKMVN